LQQIILINKKKIKSRIVQSHVALKKNYKYFLVLY